MNIDTKLVKYAQKELADYIKNISESEKNKILKQINEIDLNLINKLYINSYIDEQLNLNKVSFLKCVNSNKDKNIEIIGKRVIENGEYAIVIMAGGNASRLGIFKPKGTLEIKNHGIKMSLYEIFINQLIEIYNKFKVYINLYIMTSNSNDLDTRSFFEKNNYFNYPKNKIKFFVQDNIPLIDTFGNILLKEKDELWLVPNGNGNVFKSLKNNGIIKEMRKNKIKYCLFTGVDNPITKLIDLNFIGTTISNNYKLSSKTIHKTDPDSLEWVFCKYKNRPYMLDNNHLKYFNNIKDDNGNYLYRETNMMYHLIHIDYIEKFSKLKLKYHRSYKKYDYINKNGQLVKPDSPNAFKFEQFIYDAFFCADDMLLYKVTKDEFCPIKTKEDILKAEKILN